MAALVPRPSSTPPLTKNQFQAADPTRSLRCQRTVMFNLPRIPNYWGRNSHFGDLSTQPIFDPGTRKMSSLIISRTILARYTDLQHGCAQVSMSNPQTGTWCRANPNKLAYFHMPPWNGEVAAVAINSLAYPTNITLVRQAIVHAINYTDIAQKVFFGQIASLVGPEYPAWKQFYNLGNFTPYQYNVTLAQADLRKANITTFPTLNFTVITGCQFCIETAQIVQSDLSALEYQRQHSSPIDQ